MPEHELPLVSTIAAALVLAFGLGLLAHRLRVSPLVGYLVAGILVGPFTPGFVADQAMASQLAELGVILLLFAVGLHFSPADLLAVRGVALPGALPRLASAPMLRTPEDAPRLLSALIARVDVVPPEMVVPPL